MSAADQVKRARSPQEAMLAIAVALDRIEQKISDVDPGKWGQWDEPGLIEERLVSREELDLRQAAVHVNDLTDDEIEKLSPELREQVLDARRRLAADVHEEIEGVPEGVRPTVEVTADEITVTLPPVDEERAERRRQLTEQVLKLDANFGQEGLDDAYVKGGPLWLYNGSKEGRDFILGLPVSVRREMVKDVAVDSIPESQELGRDLLSARSEEELAPMQAVAEQVMREARD